MYAPMGTYSQQNLQRHGGRPPPTTSYYNQNASAYFGGNSTGYSSYPAQPYYVNQGKMNGPNGFVPVYDTSECLYTNQTNSTWSNYNDFKNMAKMDNDPYVSAMARMEADAQYRNLKGSSNAGHEYYKNSGIQKLESPSERKNPF